MDLKPKPIDNFILTAEDCRRNAGECLASAENAAEVEDWHAFISLACDWILAGSRLDRDVLSYRPGMTGELKKRVHMILKR